jgi:hypothetical protein
MFAIRTKRTLEALLEDLRKIQEGWLTLENDELVAVDEAVSRWSAAQHLQHLARVNDFIFSVIVKISSGDETVVAHGRPNRIGKSVLWTGRIPRGRGKAPESLRPATCVQVDEARAAIAANLDSFSSLAATLPQLSRTRGKIDHFVFGPLNARQWLRFARIHTRHHVAIAKELLR